MVIQLGGHRAGCGTGEGGEGGDGERTLGCGSRAETWEKTKKQKKTKKMKSIH